MTRDLAADGLVADPARGAVRGRRGDLEVLEFPSLHDRGVEIVVTTRSGGVSQAPYDTCNLGDHVGDDPACVEENRRRVAAAMRVDLGALMIARQVHGTDVAIVEPAGIIGDADVLATTDPSVALCVLVADCAPICLVDPCAQVLVVAHAGWRGTAARVAEVAVQAASDLGADREQLIAVIGPCISPDAYQVGAEVAEAMSAAGCGDAVAPDGTGRFTCDLVAANAAQLVRAGVAASRVVRSGFSTDGGTLLFSDRAARPCGRFALVARLRGAAS
jgi:YfiH family protein